MKFLYNLGVNFYTALIYVASLFNRKAQQWVRGRRGWVAKLTEYSLSDKPTIWFHCASLGEFEQGRPLIEKIRGQETDTRILVTFFSPSGYEIRKNYDKADLVMYLPADRLSNARKFIRLANPTKAIFIKYEFWYNYLDQLKKSLIPAYLVSGIFRESQPFFKWYGGFFRKHLHGFNHIFIQDDNSARLLDEIGIKQISVCGDTRFDRVYEISRSAAKNDIIERFRLKSMLVIAGSSWPPDEEIISRYINSDNSGTKWLFAPHQIDKGNIERLCALLKVPVVRYSEADGGDLEGAVVLIIDNIGLLSSVYRYASIAIIGGGFGKGIHNILEAATWAIPVLFGPNHLKFREAIELLEAGGAFTFSNYSEFSSLMEILLSDKKSVNKTGTMAKKYIEKNLGATETIIRKI